MHPKSPIRRTHSPEFKARVLAACRQPGASIAAVALAHGINANVVHKWLAGIDMKRFVQRWSRFTDSVASGADNSAWLVTAVMKTPDVGRRCEAFGTPQTGETSDDGPLTLFFAQYWNFCVWFCVVTIDRNTQFDLIQKR